MGQWGDPAMRRALLILLTFMIPAGAVQYTSREYRFRAYDLRFPDAPRNVYIRITCKKADDGKPGQAGKSSVTIVAVGSGKIIRISFDTFFDICPTPAEVLEGYGRVIDLTRITPIPGNPRAVSAPPVPSPAADKLYLANLTGANGRSQIDVADTRTEQDVASIDLGDRLFGGLQLSPDGRRLYAVMGPQTLGTPAPAQIAYIDTSANTIVDRFELPGVLQPQAPALSNDGRYLYFAARALETGPYRIRVADLQARTVSVLPDPAPANTELRAVALSPDGALLCSSGAGSLSCYDTRTRSFLGRVSVSLPNAGLRPVFHPNGSRIYLLGRAFVNNALSVHILVIDTGTLTEIARVPIANPAPDTFRPTLSVLSIDASGQQLVLDEGFSGVINFIDTRTNRVVKTLTGLTTGGLGGAVVVQ